MQVSKTIHVCNVCGTEVDAQGACGTEGCNTETVSVVVSEPAPLAVNTKWARVTRKAYAKALSCAKGDYQVNVVAGVEAVSGSTLKGSASKWGARYKASREALIERMRAAGLTVAIATEANNRRVLVVSC